jgi:glycosyltransferase involved in cell wall biosynthesis
MQPGGAEVLVTNSLSPGGLCEHTENHLAYFLGSSYLLDKLDKNVHVHDMAYKGFKDLKRLISHLRQIIVDNKIDIVHSHLNPAGLYTHLACPKNVPHVHTIHTTYSMDNETLWFKLWAEKQFFLTKKTAKIILLSDFAKDDFLKAVKFKGRAFVLNNFVQDDFFNIVTSRQQQQIKHLKLIAIGTLKPLKNFEYLLKVFKQLVSYDISLDIFGSGDKAAYQKLIDENGLKVTMMGHAENLVDTMAGYDLFIMPSKFEGFPLSVFEAMAAGLPLMLSAIAPLKAIVKENAIYFDLNDPEDAAQKLIAILDGKIDINVMAVKARSYAEKTVRREIYINKLLHIYDQLA